MHQELSAQENTIEHDHSYTMVLYYPLCFKLPLSVFIATDVEYSSSDPLLISPLYTKPNSPVNIHKHG